jgi:hypothetical protein
MAGSFLVTTMVFGRFGIAVMIFNCLYQVKIAATQTISTDISIGLLMNMFHLASPGGAE